MTQHLDFPPYEISETKDDVGVRPARRLATWFLAATAFWGILALIGLGNDLAFFLTLAIMLGIMLLSATDVGS